MSKVAITEQHLINIADAIREKTGLSQSYYPSEMASAILTITGGGGIIPSGTLSITENGIYNVTTYASASVSVPTEAVNNQNKNVVPTESLQSITADSGYTGLGTVTVGAISNTYVGTSVTRITALTANGSVVTAPSGFYSSALTKAITAGSAFPPAITITKNPTITVNSTTGVITATYAGTSNVTPTVTAGYISVGTAGTISTAGTNTFNMSVQSAKTITPDTIAQTAISAGYYATGIVTVGAIPSAYIIPSGTKSITANASGINVASFASVDVNVSGGGTINNQDKSVTPTESEQEITADSGYTGLGTVTVSAISSTYVGSGIPRKSSANLNVSGSTITAPIGYYASAASASVSGGSVTAPSSITGTSATISTSTNTITLTKTVSVTPSVTTAGYISSGTAGNASVSLTASTTINPTVTASGKTVTVPAGYYTAQTTKDVDTMTLPTSVSASATSGYASKATVSRSTSDQYINIPTGYNTAGGYYKINAVANGSASGPTSLSSSSATVSTGTNTITLTKTSVVTTPTVSAGYVSSATATTATVALTATVTTKAATTYHPSTTAQSISSGTYLTGAQTIAAVTTTNLSASNILSGVTIKVGDSSDDDCVASVTGSVSFATYYTGSTAPSSSLGQNGDIYLQS